MTGSTMSGHGASLLQLLSKVARKRLLRPTERVPSATVGSRAVAAAMARASAAMRKIPGAFPMVSDPAVRRPYVEEGRS